MIKVDFNKEYILAGLGCSHTQGCAFAIYGEKLKWASKELEDKYKVECTPEFITDNLTWMAKLKKYIKISKILNYGAGGLGYDNTLYALKKLSLKPNLDKYIIIVQIAHPHRKNLIWSDDGWYRNSTQREFILFKKSDTKIPNFDLFKKIYTNVFLTELYNLFDYYEKLLYFQNLLESKGAILRIFESPFYNTPAFSKKDLTIYEKLKKDLFRRMYLDPLPLLSNSLEALNKLNLLYDHNLPEILKPKDPSIIAHTLHAEGLLLGDQHYSEKGNELVAKYLFKSINKETEFKLQGDNLYYLNEKAS